MISTYLLFISFFFLHYLIKGVPKSDSDFVAAPKLSAETRFSYEVSQSFVTDPVETVRSFENKVGR